MNESKVETFQTEAMKTTWTFRLRDVDAKVAANAASACINQLAELEAQLSRFRIDSDISRINELPAEQQLYINEVTHRCLLQAIEATALTQGLFDITLGSRTHEDSDSDSTAVAGQIQIAPDQPLVTCVEAGRKIDLGGIGKGFALDELAKTLKNHQIESALLSAGSSTLLAYGSHSWPIDLTGDENTTRLQLNNAALSASGTSIQGAHVVHPDRSVSDQRYTFKRIWLITENAALADACSTACLLMDEEEIQGFYASLDRKMVIHVESHENSIIRCILK